MLGQKGQARTKTDDRMGIIKAVLHGSAEDLSDIQNLAHECEDVIRITAMKKSKVWVNEFQICIWVQV